MTKSKNKLHKVTIREYPSGLEMHVVKENEQKEFVLQHPDFALCYTKDAATILILDIIHTMGITTADLLTKV